MRTLLTYLLLCVSAFAAPFGFREAAPPGLARWWNLSEGTGSSSAASYGSVTATLENTPVWTNGFKGAGLHFAASTTQIAKLGLLNPTNAFTLSVWVKHSSGGSGYRVFWSNANDAAYNSQWWFALNASGTIYFYSSTSGSSYCEFSCGSTQPTGVWIHYAATWDASNVRIYTNGVQAGSAAMTGSLTASGAASSLGNTFGVSGNSPLHGAVDDAKFYYRALTAEEVKALYNQRGGGQ